MGETGNESGKDTWFPNGVLERGIHWEGKQRFSGVVCAVALAMKCMLKNCFLFSN
jgi:hypothetical protein